jgi:hypothetical protein
MDVNAGSYSTKLLLGNKVPFGVLGGLLKEKCNSGVPDCTVNPEAFHVTPLPVTVVKVELNEELSAMLALTVLVKELLKLA